ncbi:macro domain-containing protein [Stratiformator vulcanicus]|nr:macro domain-containing protein [Stratiformator vulcanicus]
MRRTISGCDLELVRGDITEQLVDAIVNAANAHLAGGGGVDGAIHKAAGPEIMAETDRRYPEGCPTGSAVATTAGKLNAKYVFHAVGPRWRGGGDGEEQKLRSAIRVCLDLAVEHNCESIAFPAISTGVYGYPIDLAAEATIDEIGSWMKNTDRKIVVRIVLFSEGAIGQFSRVLENYS